jgi:hypothetical protein
MAKAEFDVIRRDIERHFMDAFALVPSRADRIRGSTVADLIIENRE